MKKFPILSFLFCFLLYSEAFPKTEIILGDIPLEQNENIANVLPHSSNDLNEVIMSRKQYVLSYNRKLRSPNWVAWKLEKTNIGSVGRSNNFQEDSILENYLTTFSEHAVAPTDYYGSCYDRGHQIPSADRTNTVENNEATFLMSNMAPQTAYINRVIWAHLESYTRSLVVSKNKKIFVVTGPIYDENFGSIGPNHDISIPSKFFKVIYVLNQDQSAAEINADTVSVAVIIPNLLQNGQRPFEDLQNLCSSSTYPPLQNLTNNDWQKYQTTISEVEKESGFILTR